MTNEEALADLVRFVELKTTQKPAFLSVVVDAVKKQIPQEALRMKDKPLIDAGWKYACRNCGSGIGQNAFDSEGYSDGGDYCPCCGQRYC